METASFPQTIEIQADLACAICGYNLKGLPAAGNCPECGQPVARTYQFDLVKADPRWLGRQATTVPMLAVLFMLDFAPSISSFAAWFSYAIKLLLAGLNLWVGYRLSQGDPADPTERYGSVRRGVLLASIAVLVSTATQWPRAASLMSYSSSTPIHVTIQILLIAINTFLALFLVAQVCRRAGRTGLIKHARLSMWTLSFAQVGYLVFYVFDFRPILGAAVYILSVYNILAQAALFAGLILLGRAYEVLRAARASAESVTSIPVENL
jgi:hypothetical protein